MSFNHRILSLLVILLGLLAAGCGGGGSSVGSAVSTTKGLFITDSFSGDYDHVWVTIDKVTFNSAGGPVTAFNSPSGVVVDLKTLRDASGAKFSFLGSLDLSAATAFTGVDVVLDQNLTLVPAGSTTGISAVFAGSDLATNTKTLSFTFAAPKTITGDFCIDFTLGDWTYSAGTVTANISESNGQGLGQSDRDVENDFHGSVSALSGTAPTQTFTLSTDDGYQVGVTTSATTSLAASDGSANPTLANGQHLVVSGAFDLTTRTITATSILIVIGDADEAHAVGTPSNGDAGAGTFTLTVSEADGFVPQNADITVATSGTTKFFAASCASLSEADFFAALATATTVHVTGSFDANSQTLTAFTVRLGDGENSDLALVAGATSNPDPVKMTFDMTGMEFDGLMMTPGATVHVALTDTTTLLSSADQTLSASDFFAALASAQGAAATGTYDATSQTLTATRVKLFSAPGVDIAMVIGTVSGVDVAGQTFTLTVASWADTALSAGQTLSVTVDGTTQYRDAGGNAIDATTFFSGVSSAPSVTAYGVISNGSLAAKVLKLNG